MSLKNETSFLNLTWGFLKGITSFLSVNNEPMMWTRTCHSPHWSAGLTTAIWAVCAEPWMLFPSPLTVVIGRSNVFFYQTTPRNRRPNCSWDAKNIGSAPGLIFESALAKDVSDFQVQFLLPAATFAGVCVLTRASPLSASFAQWSRSRSPKFVATLAHVCTRAHTGPGHPVLGELLT